MDESEELIQYHDQYQFEVKLDYEPQMNSPLNRYKVETYFFIPNNLDINQSTYSKNQFYRDLLLYIRFKTPEFRLKELVDVNNHLSPLHKISIKADNYLQKPTGKNSSLLEYEFKLLGCVLKNALWLDLKEIEQGYQDPPLSPETLSMLTDMFFANIQSLLSTFRRFHNSIDQPFFSEELQASFEFSDEYISLLIENRCHHLLKFLYTLPPSDQTQITQKRLVTLIEEEMEYRKLRGFPSIVKDKEDNEMYVFRMGALKKYSGSALHLSVRTVEEGKGIQEVGLAMGAGIAMLFATAIAFYYQMVYGTLSLSFFGALVVSYMFKDRIKSLVQNYFQKVLSKNLIDHSTNLMDPFNKDKVGVCRELVHFVDEKKVDPSVIKLRERDNITDIENNWRSEQVLRYEKEIIINSKNLGQNHTRKRGLTDIVRFNIRNFLMKMDEPKTDLHILRDGRSETVPGTRVYHVNMIIKSTSHDRVQYERIRLVLNRKGIKRIEPVRSEKIDQ